jgi:TPR repeat protein
MVKASGSMPVELRLTNCLMLTGVIVAVLLSASSAFAGASEDCAAAKDRQDYAEAFQRCGDSTETAKWFRKAAEQGDADAQGWLGFMYDMGEGVQKDSTEAAKWYRKAAEQGHAHSQFSLGEMYDGGRGVTQDYAEAAKWYRKAADQGDLWAQFNLGLMYQQGDGVPQDYVLAHMWFNLAAARNSDMARLNRDKLADKMTPAQIAEAQRLAREWKPTK